MSKRFCLTVTNLTFQFIFLGIRNGYVPKNESMMQFEWKKLMIMEKQLCGASVNFGRSWEPDPNRLQYIHTVKGMGYKFEYRSEE